MTHHIQITCTWAEFHVGSWRGRCCLDSQAGDHCSRWYCDICKRQTAGTFWWDERKKGYHTLNQQRIRCKTTHGPNYTSHLNFQAYVNVFHLVLWPMCRDSGVPLHPKGVSRPVKIWHTKLSRQSLRRDFLHGIIVISNEKKKKKVRNTNYATKLVLSLVTLFINLPYSYNQFYIFSVVSD